LWNLAIFLSNSPMRVLLKALSIAGAISAAACATLPSDFPRTESHVLTDTADTRLGRASTQLLATHPGSSGVHLLERGTDAFVARLALAETAARSLDVQYYIWHGDTTGRLLLHAVLRAADRGVRVRLLLDDLGTAADDRALLMIDAHPNVEVRLFNPVAHRSMRLFGMLADLTRVNRRMHNKSFTADNQATIVGGRNIGDEYFEARPDLDFGDLDALVIGAAVNDVSDGFDRYWNSAHVWPIRALSKAKRAGDESDAVRTQLREFAESQRDSAYADRLRVSALAQQLRDAAVPFAFGQVRVLYDDPAKIGEPQATPGATAGKEAMLLAQMLPEFEALREELVLVSPYFVPGKAGVTALRKLRERGVRVRIVTNSLASTDVSIVHSGYSRYRRVLLEAGIELYEVKPTVTREEPRTRSSASAGLSGSSRASLHAKTLVFDRRSLFVGSMNVDPRSVFTNTEIGVMIGVPALAGDVAQRLVEALPQFTYRLELKPTAADTEQRALEWVSEDAGREVRYSTDPQTSAWRRFSVWFFSLLPIESLL